MLEKIKENGRSLLMVILLQIVLKSGRYTDLYKVPKEELKGTKAPLLFLLTLNHLTISDISRIILMFVKIWCWSKKEIYMCVCLELVIMYQVENSLKFDGIIFKKSFSKSFRDIKVCLLFNVIRITFFLVPIIFLIEFAAFRQNSSEYQWLMFNLENLWFM